MLKTIFLTAPLCLVALGVSASRPALAPAPLASLRADPSADTASIDAILTATYAAISGPAGQARDWDRFRALFHPGGARLMSVGPNAEGKTEVRIRSVDQYVAGASGYFEANGFFEREVARRVERFGHIAHVFSTYETLHSADGEPFARGINSFQLLWDEERWWVLSILWDSESETQPIPASYLRSPGEGR